MIILKSWFRNSNEWIRSKFLPEKGIDLLLLLTVIALVFFGLIMVYSASFILAQEKTGDGFAFIRKQVFFAGCGFAALWVGFKIDYKNWSKWAYPVLGVALLFLVAILIPGVGEKVGGARRWIHLGPVRFQPGELAKFAVILFVARQLVVKQAQIRSRMRSLMSPLLIPLPIILLLLFQPDFGTTVIIGSVVFVLMFLSGVEAKYLGPFLGLAFVISGMLVFGTAYRRNRLFGFLDPLSDPGGKGFQIIQSFVGLHSGGIWGVGLGSGKEKLFFLPEAHNDFIFSVIGEELGFVGILGVIGAYVFFIYRGLKIAWNAHFRSQDRFGLLLGAGITLAIGIQGFVNIAVVMGLLPTKGLTLPFISYGGSALLVDLFAIGVLLRIGKGSESSQNLKNV